MTSRSEFLSFSTGILIVQSVATFPGSNSLTPAWIPEKVRQLRAKSSTTVGAESTVGQVWVGASLTRQILTCLALTEIEFYVWPLTQILSFYLT